MPRLVEDTSFGSYQVLSKDPLRVKYTIRNPLRWSDGTRVDAADLLLAWVANSGARNTPGFDDTTYVDQDTGQYAADFPRDAVFFDGATSDGLQLVTKTPVIGDDEVAHPYLGQILRRLATRDERLASRPRGGGPEPVTFFV